MAIVHYTEASGGLPNSGRLSGTDGDLVGIMDVVLVAAGWAIEYTGTNTRVYRPATGNRFRLHMNDAAATSGSAGLCVVRGCENASSSTVLVDPFPTVAQIANGSANWLKSSAVNTTARNFDIWASPTFVIYAVNFSGVAGTWEWHFWGDCAPTLSADSYNTLCMTRNSSSISSSFGFTATINTSVGTNNLFWCRNFNATVKSTCAAIRPPSNASAIGVLSQYPPAFNGPSSGLDTQKISLTDSGAAITTPSASNGLPIRGWMPNVRFPMHDGQNTTSPASRDTYTDTAYNASFVGTAFTRTSGVNQGFLVIEGSDTWVAPSG